MPRLTDQFRKRGKTLTRHSETLLRWPELQTVSNIIISSVYYSSHWHVYIQHRRIACK